MFSGFYEIPLNNSHVFSTLQRGGRGEEPALSDGLGTAFSPDMGLAAANVYVASNSA
jgi:hypothetical protein